MMAIITNMSMNFYPTEVVQMSQAALAHSSTHSPKPLVCPYKAVRAPSIRDCGHSNRKVTNTENWYLCCGSGALGTGLLEEHGRVWELP